MAQRHGTIDALQRDYASFVFQNRVTVGRLFAALDPAQF
jgi:hypothetical protein